MILNNMVDIRTSYVTPKPTLNYSRSVKEVIPKITLRQAKLALASIPHKKAGTLFDLVDNFIASMEEGTMKKLAKIEWEYANDFERDSEVLNTLAKAMGITDEELDLVFKIGYTL